MNPLVPPDGPASALHAWRLTQQARADERLQVLLQRSLAQVRHRGDLDHLTARRLRFAQEWAELLRHG